MKTPTRIEARLTHGYVGTCAHLDSWTTVCNARVTAPRLVKAPADEEASDGGSRAFIVALSPAQLAAARKVYSSLKSRLSFYHFLERSIEQNYTSAGCHHEHDCCGCASDYAEAYQTKAREFTVVVRRSYNY